jgi:hypothetical protein
MFPYTFFASLVKDIQAQNHANKHKIFSFSERIISREADEHDFLGRDAI